MSGAAAQGSGSRAELQVVQAGPWTTYQDPGRPGYMRFGVPQSGPMDRSAFAAAHAALGNPADATAIELSAGGIELECVSGSVTLAVAGGGFRVDTDLGEAAGWMVTTLRKGNRVSVKPGWWGNWCYLAFAGTLQAREWLGSHSTHGPSGLGGGHIRPGEGLLVEAAEVRRDRERSLPMPPWAKPRQEIRAVLGPQERYFTAEAIEAIANGTFQLTTEYDRMGVRLRGSSLPIAAQLSMPSEAILRGSIQVPGHGDPIVLLADHQSTGGYPKIATIASLDQDAFAQLRPRDHVHFKLIGAEQAIEAARIRRLAVETYLTALVRGAAA
jgi:allophanate hydrolase